MHIGTNILHIKTDILYIDTDILYGPGHTMNGTATYHAI
jgi:hypothetical protein